MFDFRWEVLQQLPNRHDQVNEPVPSLKKRKGPSKPPYRIQSCSVIPEDFDNAKYAQQANRINCICEREGTTQGIQINREETGLTAMCNNRKNAVL
jgi:hypothetical protein